MNRFFILLVLAFSVLPFFFIDASGEMLFKTMEQNYNTGSVVYILLLIASVVVAPFTFPLFAIEGELFGVVPAALYNIFGWSMGATIAFLLARYLGKSYLE
ncbi:MAG: hypothetical protein COZ99_03410 [Parcubacteria group bacterium CG_4_8_14_3_um_filter_48_16]|nr:MAG: hypothetical protein AUK21_03185 [Parcubacteria group bacterium CG2_30_48_51]PIW79002.1 MAG: hypothetical protein COZ99_03410 [Parcubacteria group bacterium CG_4_8_14_3_um_filter_48_16]PIZ77632.1 MAG: hypothetical protein COY03_02155 [bacterium CG_4_10_14_0_2_um_filter_48_144]PJC39652.1 MAG: hypothetical protein CO043_03085 [Parcubacteria group bacterium CG_4_9_14_0_2_um_filter_48_40]